MITSYKEYKEYLEADRKALSRDCRYGLKQWLMDDIWTFQRLLRKVEYYHNCKRSRWANFVRRVLYYRLHRLAVRLSFSVPINTCGKGLALAHYGSIVISTKARIGENTQIYVGVNVGEGAGAKAPQIGNNCYLAPGAKLYGGIVIGDNVKVGANAVVNKSFPEGNCTLVGAPARKVQKRD